MFPKYLKYSKISQQFSFGNVSEVLKKKNLLELSVRKKKTHQNITLKIYTYIKRSENKFQHSHKYSSLESQVCMY